MVLSTSKGERGVSTVPILRLERQKARDKLRRKVESIQGHTLISGLYGAYFDIHECIVVSYRRRKRVRRRYDDTIARGAGEGGRRKGGSVIPVRVSRDRTIEREKPGSPSEANPRMNMHTGNKRRTAVPPAGNRTRTEPPLRLGTSRPSAAAEDEFSIAAREVMKRGAGKVRVRPVRFVIVS